MPTGRASGEPHLHGLFLGFALASRLLEGDTAARDDDAPRRPRSYRSPARVLACPDQGETTMKIVQRALASLILAFVVLAGAAGSASATSSQEEPVTVGDRHHCGGGCNQ